MKKHKNNEKSKEHSVQKKEAKSKPKPIIQTNIIQALFQKGAQPKKVEINTKMQE